MPIRNPFKKAQTAQEIHEQNHPERISTDKGFQETIVRASPPVEIKEAPEYKLSDINDSGEYLPPSPPAREKSFFSRTSTSSSTAHSFHKSHVTENEPFNISRESFDSYRRSFDISARSPISTSTFDAPPRGSLDSRKLNAYSPRPSYQGPTRRSEQFPREAEPDRFVDVGLNDEAKPAQKKRGLFSRFGDDSSNKISEVEPKAPSATHNFLSGLSGRKRGQSGTGSELSSIPRPDSRSAVEVGAN